MMLAALLDKPCILYESQKHDSSAVSKSFVMDGLLCKEDSAHSAVGAQEYRSACAATWETKAV